MRIDLTVAQAEALDDPLYADDDNLRVLPDGVLVGELGVILADPEDPESEVVGYAMAHPGLGDTEDVVFKHVLEERALELAQIKAAPQGAQNGLRRAVEQRLGDRGKSANQAEARARRVAEPDIAQKLADRAAEREAEAQV